MRFSYYTIDDLRLGHDPRGVTGWRLSQFLHWRDALEHYRSLLDSQVKEVGLTNGMQVLQLVRCLPLFPTDRMGHDILLTDDIVQPFWRTETQAAETAKTAAELLGIRFCLAGEQIVPAPKPLPERLKELCPRNAAPVVKWVYVASVDWLTPEDFRRRYRSADRTYHYPLVLKYLEDTVTGDGRTRTEEVTPWEYRWLERRAGRYACTND